MEQQEPRKKFVKNLHKFCETIKLNKAFLEGLKKHSNCEYVEEVMKFKDEMAKKSFIFLEFTRERSTCDEMVKILEDSGQIEAANQLKEYNTSPGFMPMIDEIELKVIPATVLRSGGSKHFEMDQNPKGKCLIINNVEGELGKESLRFKNIFEQIRFDVELCSYMTAEEMENKLKDLSKDERLKKDNALVVMIITHGQDESVIGFDGEELKISTIVDLFSEKNCSSMNRKPKLFFFNCCRNKIEKKSVPVVAKQEKNKIFIELETVGQNWINENKYTLICFSCAEGDKSWYTPKQYTFFGQALSHCIAQFACDKSVQSIMNLTCERMSEKGSPEIRCCKMTRDLYLNPGLPKNM